MSIPNTQMKSLTVTSVSTTHCEPENKAGKQPTRQARRSYFLKYLIKDIELSSLVVWQQRRVVGVPVSHDAPSPEGFRLSLQCLGCKPPSWTCKDENLSSCNEDKTLELYWRWKAFKLKWRSRCQRSGMKMKIFQAEMKIKMLESWKEDENLLNWNEMKTL